MKDWEYSNLTHEACLAGGPEALLERKFNEGYDAGMKAKRPDQYIWLMAGAVAGYIMKYIADNYIAKLSKPKNETSEIRMMEKAIEEEHAEEEISLEELKDRLNSLEHANASEADMDVVIQYVDIFGLNENDESVMRIVKGQTDYQDYADRFLQVVPDAKELDVIRAYIEWVRPFEGDDVYR